MKKLLNLIMLLALLMSTSAKAEITSNVLLYIQPYEYQNEVKLQHFSHEYWFAQGPMVEPIAKEKLGKLLGGLSMCEGNDTGKMLIWLQPKMFYNAQLQVFYGEISTNVYTGVGKLVGTYIGEYTQHGHLDIKPAHWLNKAYNKAMDNLVEKMQADSQLQSITSAAKAGDTPCSMVALLPLPKVRAMSF